MILCGGGGERLWPLSRKKKPKQFISFSKNGTLLEQTIKRVSPVVSDKKRVGIVTTEKQIELLSDQVRENVGIVIKEPAGRNTAPAILYSLFELEKKDKDAIVVFLPADSFVAEDEMYQTYVNKAIEYAQMNEKIVTLGVIPTRPATGYGYIQAVVDKHSTVTCGLIYEVSQFHEKPDKKTAERYMNQGNMFWNISVFIAKVSVFINECKTCAPQLFEQMKDFLSNKISYDALESISIDYAVMEKSKNVSVLPCDFEWSDVGNLDVFLSLQQRLCKKRGDIEIINIESDKNLVQLSQNDGDKKKAVVFLGVDDICLIEDDNVILVAHRREVEKVKQVLQTLRKKSLEEFI